MLVLSGCAGAGTAKQVNGTVARPDATQGVENADKGKLTGVVTDDEAVPIEGATVGLFLNGGGEPSSVVTGQAGEFAFLGVEPGTYLVTVSKIGHKDASQGNVEVGS